MQNLVEIRWHGRGGQGAVTAAKIFAEAALAEGKYIQAFPEYGPERMGAPIKAFDRLSNKPLSLHSQVYYPNVVVVIDPTLIQTANITEGLAEDGILIVNSPKNPSEIRAELNLKSGKVYTVDATKISLEVLGKFMPNTPMLGALVKATGLVSVEKVLEEIRGKFAGKLKEELIQGNLNAIKRAFDEVKGE